jgi:hypothetical protein
VRGDELVPLDPVFRGSYPADLVERNEPRKTGSRNQRLCSPSTCHAAASSSGEWLAGYVCERSSVIPTFAAGAARRIASTAQPCESSR